MNRTALLLLLLPMVWAAPAAAQPMDPNMPGMNMSAAKAKPAAKHTTHKRLSRKAPAAANAGHDMSKMPGMAMPAAPAQTGPHAGHDMSAMPGTAMPAGPAKTGPSGGHDMSAMPGMTKRGTAAMPGMDMPGSVGVAGHDMAAMGPPPLAETQQPPPRAPADHAAERFYDPADMAAARQQLRREHGGETYSMVMANIAEYQAHSGGGGYRWEGQAWFGGDINRLLLTSEGQGARRDGLDAAEVQALYARAIGPYFNLLAGVRQDFKPTPRRTYATLGVEGLAPYRFDVLGEVFLSNQGELLVRAEGSYDLRLTQRLVLQPRAELNFAAQDTRETGIGSGLSDAALDLRLRYEIRKDFAPYIGVSYDKQFGRTADYARTAGQKPGRTSLVVGIRAWF